MKYYLCHIKLVQFMKSVQGFSKLLTLDKIPGIELDVG
jgi:hypothetical protein